MAQVGVDNEPLYERLMFLFDGTNYRVFKGDTDGNIVAALKDDQNVEAKGYGFVNANWQKGPMPIGYSGIATEMIAVPNGTSGTNTLNGAAVPAGEIWVLQSACVRDITNICTQEIIYVLSGSDATVIIDRQSPPASSWLAFSGAIVLEEGDTVNGQFTGVTLNDNLDLRYHCMRIDIDQ